MQKKHRILEDDVVLNRAMLSFGEFDCELDSVQGDIDFNAWIFCVHMHPENFVIVAANDQIEISPLS